MTAWILGSLVLLVLVLTAHAAIRRPHLRRMAWGHFVRHRTMTGLTLLGAMIGTALITSTLLLQSSMLSSRENVFEEQFGRIYSDIPAVGQTLLSGQGYFSQGDADSIAGLIGQPHHSLLEATLPTVGFQTTWMKPDESGRPLLIAPKAYVHGFDPEAARAFDAQALEGVTTDLGRDEVVLSARAAAALEVGAGDSVMLYDHQRRKVTLRVRAVVPEQGLTGYRGTERALSTGIVSLATARELAGVPEGEFSSLLLAKRADFVVPSGARVDLVGGSGWVERSVQAETANDLERNLKFIPVFNIASVNAVVIGIVLILNLFKMMAEERRRDLGVLRAIGLTRRDLARMLRMEGVCYALASSVIGVLAGIGISYLLLIGMRRSMSTVLEYEMGVTMRYEFSVDPSVLLIGFSTGVLLIFLCTWAISRKAARLQIVEALHESDGGRGMKKGAGRHSIARTGLALGSGVVTLGFLLVTMTGTFQEWVNGIEAFPLVIFLLGFVMIGLTVLLLTTSMHVITSALQGLLRPFRRLTGVLRLSLRYPEVKRSRTALLVSMFALVFFLTSFSGVFSTSMTQYFGRFDPRAALGGFDLSAEAPGRMMTSEALEKWLLSSEHVRKGSLAATASVWQIGGEDEAVNGIDEAFLRGHDIALADRAPQYASDEAAWEAVVQDPNLVIISEHFHQDYEVGQPFPVAEGQEKTIIGIARYQTEMYGYPASYGAWVKQSEILRLTHDPREVRSQLLLKISAEDRKAAAKGVEMAFTLEGIYPLVNPVESYLIGTSFITVFFSLFEGFSALATLIGIVGLMVVMLRVIRERRQQIGMLRAIGVRPGTIYWSILIEGALIGFLGITLGLCVGCYTGLLMIGAFGADGSHATAEIDAVLPVARLLLYFGGALVVTLFCAAIPARQAMRLSPAEATRYLGS